MTDPLEMNVRMVGRADELRKHNQVRFRQLQAVAMEMFDAVANGEQKDAVACIVGYLDREASAAEDFGRQSESKCAHDECKAWRGGVLDSIERATNALRSPR